jgi:hypothetical protein
MSRPWETILAGAARHAQTQAAEQARCNVVQVYLTTDAAFHFRHQLQQGGTIQWSIEVAVQCDQGSHDGTGAGAESTANRQAFIKGHIQGVYVSAGCPDSFFKAPAGSDDDILFLIRWQRVFEWAVNAKDPVIRTSRHDADTVTQQTAIDWSECQAQGIEPDRHISR